MCRRISATGPGVVQPFVNGIAPDGSFAVGQVNSGGYVAAKWNLDSNTLEILASPDGVETQANVVSDDGLWIGGSSFDFDTFTSRALLWDSEGAYYDLEALALAAGFDLQGISLRRIESIVSQGGGLYDIFGTGASDSLFGLEQAYVFHNVALPALIPEPSAFGVLAGFGALGLAATRRRRRA
jgi:hypothetical protein